MATHTNFATAIKSHSQSYAPGPKGATEVTATGMSSSGNFVKDVEGAIVALNTSLVRGNKSTTKSIGVDRSHIMDLLQNVLDKCSSLDRELRETYLHDLFRLIFQKRAIRSAFGGGERTLTFWLLIGLYPSYPATVKALIKQIPEYGSWQDFKGMYKLVHNDVRERAFLTREQALELMKIMEDDWAYQLTLDYQTYLRNKTRTLTPEEKEDNTISLCAKWIPKNGSSLGKLTHVDANIAKRVWNGKGPDIAASRSANYRRMYAALNAEINTTERLMASRQWDKINFRLVPGRCLNKFHRVWLDETKSGERKNPGDEVREMCRKNYQEFLKAVAEGKATAKGKAMFVHELANEIIEATGYTTLEAWKQANPERYTLINAQFNDHVEAIKTSTEDGSTGVDDTVFLSDVSGSMNGDPMGTSVAVSVIGSALSTGAYKNLVLTFESICRVVDLSYPKTALAYSQFPGYSYDRFPIGSKFEPSRVGKELDWIEKIYVLSKSGWGGSTNFVSALDKIVTIAETYKVPLPKRVICITDMAWDAADRSGSESRYSTDTSNFMRKLGSSSMPYKTLLGQIETTLQSMGYTLPEFIVWNARGRDRYEAQGYAATADDPRTKLISGFNVSMLKLFLSSGELVEPPTKDSVNNDGSYELLTKMFRHEDYDNISVIVDSVGEVNGTRQAHVSEYKESASASNVWTAPSFAQVVANSGSLPTPPVVSAPIMAPPVLRRQSTTAAVSTTQSIDDMVDNLSREDMRVLLQKLMDKI